MSDSLGSCLSMTTTRSTYSMSATTSNAVQECGLTDCNVISRKGDGAASGSKMWGKKAVCLKT
jgi:hypothetical protein